MRKKSILIIITVASCILLGALWFYKSFSSNTQVVIWKALQALLNEEYQTKLNMHVDSGEKDLELAFDMYRVKDDDEKYLVFEQDGFPIYVAGNKVVLENGKAFKISDKTSSSEESDGTDSSKTDRLFQKVIEAYKEFEFTTEQVGEESHHSVSVTGNLIDQILTEVMPVEKDTIAKIDHLQMIVVTKGESVIRMQLSGSSVIDEKDVRMEVVLSEFQILSDGEYSIPTAVKKSVKDSDEDDLLCLTKDFYPLIKAGKSFDSLADRDGSVRFGIDFWLIQLDTTLPIEELRKGTDKVENSSSVQKVPSWLGLLFLEGEISCINENETYTYVLELDAESTKKISEMMVPSLRLYQFEFTKSEAKLVVQEDEISSMAISINGMVDIFIKEIPLKLELEYMFSSKTN